MNLIIAIFRLTANAEAIASLARNIPELQMCWKPTPEEWSILEVICHLYDEEREDFRQRVDYTLHRPGEAWPPINPSGWVTERGYNGRDLDTMLASFLREREASVTWLRSLSSPDWTLAHEHPAAGRMTAGNVLGAWVAHDHLHIRQLNQLHWQYLATQVESVSLEYAGGW